MQTVGSGDSLFVQLCELRPRDDVADQRRLVGFGAVRVWALLVGEGRRAGSVHSARGRCLLMYIQLIRTEIFLLRYIDTLGMITIESTGARK